MTPLKILESWRKCLKNEAPEFFFRLDFGTPIGFGHYSRSRNLVQELERLGAICYYICRPPASGLSEFNDDRILWLPVLDREERNSITEKHNTWIGKSVKEDAAETAVLIQGKSVNKPILVVDHYAITQVWVDLLYKKVSQFVFIDDIGDRDLNADYVFNSNSEYLTSNYPAFKHVFIGPDYALLNSKYSELKSKISENTFNNKSNRLLVFMGGNDIRGLTKVVLNSVLNFNRFRELDVTVVYHDSHNDYHDIKCIAKNHNNIKVISYVDDMAEFLLSFPVAIGTAGVASLERACLGVVTLTISMAENQNRILQMLKNKSAAISLGKWSELDPKTIVDGLNYLYGSESALKSVARNSRLLVDGRGAERVANILMEGAEMVS